MADGSQCCIEDVKPGAMVIASPDGRSGRVINTFHGRENEVIYLRTTGGRELYISQMHRIETDAGFLPAKDLLADMQILTADGMEALEALCMVDYSDEVYNLEIEFMGGAKMICNGIVVADAADENRRLSIHVSSLSEDMAMFKELKRCMAEL